MYVLEIDDMLCFNVIRNKCAQIQVKKTCLEIYYGADNST